MKPSALIITVLAPIGIALLFIESPAAPWTPLRILGLVLVLVGGVFLTVARWQLGNSFSIRPEAHELVATGIYSRIRNPIYVFGTLLIAGLPLYLNRLEYFWLFIILIPMQVLRARAEGRVLEERFGDAYRHYKSQTWF